MHSTLERLDLQFHLDPLEPNDAKLWWVFDLVAFDRKSATPLIYENAVDPHM